MKPEQLAIGNPRGKTFEAQIAWTADLMSALRPGGVWVLPRSVSTVWVLSRDPPVARVRSIFPDEPLLKILWASGWNIQISKLGEAQ